MTCDDYTPHNNHCTNCGKTEQEHYPTTTPKNCQTCDNPIPLARLEALPNTNHCTKCVDKHGPTKTYDPYILCAKASQSSQNGFAASD